MRRHVKTLLRARQLATLYWLSLTEYMARRIARLLKNREA